MQSLRYTNFLLTVIAVCLVYQCMKFDAAPSVAATAKAVATRPAKTAPAGPIEVKIVGTPDVNVVSVYGTDKASAASTPIPVTVVGPDVRVNVANQPEFPSSMNVTVTNWASSALPVTIDGVSPSVGYQPFPIPVKIDGVSPSVGYQPFTIPVKIVK